VVGRRQPVELAELLLSQSVQLAGQLGVGTDRRRHSMVE
jgi:hypothetical protein